MPVPWPAARPRATIAAWAQSGGTPTFCNCLRFMACRPTLNSQPWTLNCSATVCGSWHLLLPIHIQTPSHGPEELPSRQFALHWFQHQFRAVTVQHAGGVNDQAPNQTERINQQMPLASLHLFPGVVAANGCGLESAGHKRRSNNNDARLWTAPCNGATRHQELHVRCDRSTNGEPRA